MLLATLILRSPLLRVEIGPLVICCCLFIIALAWARAVIEIIWEAVQDSIKRRSNFGLTEETESESGRSI